MKSKEAEAAFGDFHQPADLFSEEGMRHALAKPVNVKEKQMKEVLDSIVNPELIAKSQTKHKSRHQRQSSPQ
jgi:hypothetical protein